MKTVLLRPSKKFHALLVVHGNLNAAATRWGVPYMTLREWLDGEKGLPGNTVARLIEVTGLRHEDLFDHKVKR